MSELRKDYILDEWVIIATERAKRPDQFKSKNKKEKTEVDYFASGNEKYTPGEILRVNDKNNKWKIRVFPNKYPAVNINGNPEIQTHNKFYTFADAYGYHEVIVETPLKNKQLWDLSKEDLVLLFEVYCNRIDQLSKKPGIKYVQIFKNHGIEAGTSIQHSHSQVIAFDNVPERVQEEINKSKPYGCAYCEIIQREKDSYRRCFETDNFIAFTPYASRFPFEIWLFSKEHIKYLHDCDFSDLAKIFIMILKKLKELNASFNFMIYYSPSDHDNLHFHIEFLPRMTTWAGFEYSGTVINPVIPEDAAKFYRNQ